ncbi:MAG TPA: hypothetical protein PK466_02075 [Thermotogota bacterium]|nr:hypothetical protein [Thermotogota bacterium]HPJ88001.1 hypothetical protein [Thermotogota bacterium]HPR95088.1 hypothetical protein [Thermotogota bacterium]
MKKVFLGVFFLALVASLFASDFLMIYPDGYAVKGNTISTSGSKIQIDVPDTWLSDSFVADPYPEDYVFVDKLPFDMSVVLKSYIGKEIKWMFKDGSVKSYTLLYDNPVLLSGDLGVFSPEEGLPLFDAVEVGEARRYLDLTFSHETESLKYSYMFYNLNYNTVYNLTLNESDGSAELIGTIAISNDTKDELSTENLFIFSGDVNRVESTVYSRNAKMMDFAVESYMAGGVAAQDFEDYKIFSLPGEYTFEKGTVLYSKYLDTDIDFEKIYTYSGYYSSGTGDFKPLEQTIKIDKLPVELMAGKIRIQKENNGNMIFLGENSVKNKSKGQSLEIGYGNSYDLQGKIDLINSNRSGKTYFESYRFTCKNFSDEKKELQLNFTVPRDASVTVDKVAYKRDTATLLQIPLTVYPESDVEVTFEISYDR